ncbi:glutathione S-transferase, partial [Haematococcus lacustris]
VKNHTALVRFALRGPGQPGPRPVSAPLADPTAIPAEEWTAAATGKPDPWAPKTSLRRSRPVQLPNCRPARSFRPRSTSETASECRGI